MALWAPADGQSFIQERGGVILCFCFIQLILQVVNMCVWVCTYAKKTKNNL